MTRRAVAVALLAGFVFACAKPSETPPPAPPAGTAGERAQAFEATAYTVEGETAAGTNTRRGVVAADPKVLPIGTRIRVDGAGNLSGEYRVEDTGRTIDGREIDIYVPTAGEAKRFGRQQVQVKILEHGDGDVR
jgi:3D (Asp-Asp-Asp) domain-containing protein